MDPSKTEWSPLLLVLASALTSIDLYICIQTNICNISSYLFVSVCIHIYLSINQSKIWNIYIFVYILYIHVHLFTCLYQHVYIQVHKHTHTHTHTYKWHSFPDLRSQRMALRTEDTLTKTANQICRHLVIGKFGPMWIFTAQYRGIWVVRFGERNALYLYYVSDCNGFPSESCGAWSHVKRFFEKCGENMSSADIIIYLSIARLSKGRGTHTALDL